MTKQERLNLPIHSLNKQTLFFSFSTNTSAQELVFNSCFKAKKMKNIIFLFAIVLIPILVLGQKSIDARFNRAGVSVVVDEKNESFFGNLELEDLGNKYYFNKIDKPYLNGEINLNSIQFFLNENHIASKSLESIRSMDNLLERAKYNLTDDKVNLLKSSALGIEGYKSEKWLVDIIKNNYILVLSYRNIRTQDALDDKKDAVNSVIGLLGGSSGDNSKRYSEGYIANVDCFLFKIEMADVDYAAFTRVNWLSPNSHQKYKYNLLLVAQSSCKVDCTVPISKNMDLKKSLLELGALQALEHLGNIYSPIASKVGIEQTLPIKAKLGEKEGLFIDQLFFTYEYRQKRNGEVFTRKTGVVRAKKIVDNTQYATGNSDMSTFYRAHWGRYKTGMFLVQKRDKGTNMSLGIGNLPVRNYYGKISYNLGRKYDIAFASQFRIFGEFGYIPLFRDENKAFKDYANSNDIKFLDAAELHSIFLGIGFEKDIFILGGIQISPFISVVNEWAQYSNKDLIKEMLGKYELPKKYGNALYVKGGVRFPINLLYNLKIVPMVGYSTRNFKASKGLGFTEKFKNYPNRIIINNNPVFSGVEIKFEF